MTADKPTQAMSDEQPVAWRWRLNAEINQPWGPGPWEYVSNKDRLPTDSFYEIEALCVATAPTSDAQAIPPIFYNGDTKRDPALRKLVNRKVLAMDDAPTELIGPADAPTEKVTADAGSLKHDEPVAWMTKSDGYVFYGYNKPDRVEEDLLPLYTASSISYMAANLLAERAANAQPSEAQTAVRAAALEEAAKVADAHNAIMATTTAQLIANAIRALSQSTGEPK